MCYNMQIRKTVEVFHETTSFLGMGRRGLSGHGAFYRIQTKIIKEVFL